MIGMYVRILIVFLIIDINTLTNIRGFLRHFLIGARNRKIAKEIWRRQSIMDKILLGYIYDYLEEYKTEFKYNHAVYLIYLYTSILLYLTLVVLTILRVEFKLSEIYNMLYALLAIKVLFFLIPRIQMDSLHRSKYLKGK